MSFIDSLLTETVTYWSPATLNQFGRPSYGTPTTLTGRKEQKNELFIDASGRESLAESVYWLSSDVAVQGYLFLGSSTASDPTQVVGAKEIRAFQKTPSLDGDVFNRKAFV